MPEDCFNKIDLRKKKKDYIDDEHESKRGIM